MSPQAIRDVLGRLTRKIGTPESPVAVVTSSGARFFLRQLAEPALRNVYFLSHNEIPPEVKMISLGVVQ
jgi:flagellar biosynthesis protein FlhA